VSDLDLPFVSSPVPGAKSLEWAARLRNVESPDTTFLSSDFPVFWTRGNGCLVYDDDGNRFLDLTSSFGVLSVGHCHPKVVEAINRQSTTLIHGMGDVHPSVVKVELLETISRFSPIPNPRIILGQNGSDAVEAALKTAYLATGKQGVVAFAGGYHGLSYGALEPTERSFFRSDFEKQRGRFTSHIPFGCDPLILDTAINNSPIPVGALIVEPIQGRAGIVVPRQGWLRDIHEVCRRNGVLLILDEIFTGWGRTGSWFACDADGVVPDLLCIGKGMGGGMPLSACLGSQGLMEAAWPKSLGEAKHTYTFLGHPLACAAAVATINVLKSEGLVERSAQLGSRLLADLQSIAAAYPEVIVEVRGRGLMMGIEFARPALVWQMVVSGLANGMILLPAGDRGQVLEIVPPFILTDRQAKWAVETLQRLIAGLRNL